jgi:hypothetical protein
MHDNLWAGVESALESAQFHFLEASLSLQPPERTAMGVVLESAAGTTVVKRWEEPFYKHVESSLSLARSVSDVFESGFGHDKAPVAVVRNWFNARSPDEQTRRREFSKQFKSDRDLFRDHHLTKARDVTLHRCGFAPIKGVVIGPTGKRYPASPIMSVPNAESPSFGDNAPPWAGTQHAIPVWPSGDEFTIDGKPLFPELQAYLQLAHQLRDRARDICRRVHDGKHLTPPPG